MTDNLIERLRRAADSNACTPIGDLWNLCDEAADEIERLREILGRIEEASAFFASPESPDSVSRYAHETTRRLAHLALHPSECAATKAWNEAAKCES